MQEVARSDSVRGEVVLARRDDGSLELRVNGVFVMDNVETTTERLLATKALDALTSTRRAGEDVSSKGHECSTERAEVSGVAGSAGMTVLVGGLGLGFTVGQVLLDPRIAHVIVAEIEPDLVGWHRDGVITLPTGHKTAPALLADPRVSVVVGDVRDVVSACPANSTDAILLDVDNGPGFLVYDANAAVYGADFLVRCAAALTPGGVLAVWSADASADLLTAMRQAFRRVDECAVPVRLGRRAMTYHLFVGSAPSSAA